MLDIIGTVADSAGILTLFVALYTAWKVRQQQKRFREVARQSGRIDNFQQLVRSFEGIKTEKPLAFALALTPNNPSIKNDVSRFLQIQGWQMDVEEITMDGINNRDDLEVFVKNLEERKRFFQSSSYTEMHLFINGPVQAGTIIGALYDNWIPIKLYHRNPSNPNGTYEYWMPLVGS